MPERIRIFIDFWNFQLQWNATVKNKHINWKRLTQALIDETSKITNINNYQYNGCKVYTFLFPLFL